jgi:[ribosomal protein S18]-alanine N-acetyltransferase
MASVRDVGGVGGPGHPDDPGGALEIRVRPMDVADLDQVIAIERASFTMPWTLDTFRGLLRRADADLFVADVADGPASEGSAADGSAVEGSTSEGSTAEGSAADGSTAGRRVVAYAAVWMVVDQAELGDIAVAAEWRRRGIARRLIDTVLEHVGRRGVREIFLEVRPSNHEARRLYERYGFEAIGRRKNYYSSPREDALVLRRPVVPGP